MMLTKVRDCDCGDPGEPGGLSPPDTLLLWAWPRGSGLD